MNWLANAVAAFFLGIILFAYLGYSGVAAFGFAASLSLICISIWASKNWENDGE